MRVCVCVCVCVCVNAFERTYACGCVYECPRRSNMGRV